MARSEQELLQAVLEAREKVNGFDNLLKDAKKVKTEAETALLSHMDDTEKKMFKSTIFPCTVTKKETLYASMNPESKDEALRFIEEDCGRGDIIKRTIHNKTLSSFIGQRIKNAELIPDELFKHYWKPELQIRMS